MKTALLLLLVAAPAVADCTKIDYVEAKDWPVDKVERQYCQDLAVNKIKMDLWTDLRNSGLLSKRDSSEIMAQAQVCLEQAELMGRVLTNLHGRPRPSCKK